MIRPLRLAIISNFCGYWAVSKHELKIDVCIGKKIEKLLVFMRRVLKIKIRINKKKNTCKYFC